MILYPKIYINNVKEITEKIIIENNIKAIILDVDNTLIDLNKNILEGSKQWCENLKRKGIKFCILSNTNHRIKVEKVAKYLDIPYIYFAKKPFKGGFKKVKKIVNEENENIAVVGDQIFTDVLGANISKMFSILVKPIEEKDLLITKIKRPIEKVIIKKFLQKNEK